MMLHACVQLKTNEHREAIRTSRITALNERSEYKLDKEQLSIAEYSTSRTPASISQPCGCCLHMLIIILKSGFVLRESERGGRQQENTCVRWKLCLLKVSFFGRKSWVSALLMRHATMQFSNHIMDFLKRVVNAFDLLKNYLWVADYQLCRAACFCNPVQEYIPSHLLILILLIKYVGRGARAGQKYHFIDVIQHIFSQFQTNPEDHRIRT